jgi:signal recognition particle subunit SRP54
MGDVLTLIEKAERTYDQQEAARLERKLRKGEFDLEDFLQQLRQLRKMGPLGDLLGMVPGGGKLLKQTNVSDEEMERAMKRTEAIILSMTPEERRKPKILNGSRKRRIARGSGTTVTEVNQLLRQYRQMQKLFKQLGRSKKGRGLSLSRFF